MPQRAITLFTDAQGENLVRSFSELLDPDAVQGVATLEAAARTASDLLILYLPKFNREERIVPAELIDDLKGKKILAVGFTAGRIFDELDLQIGALHGVMLQDPLPKIRAEHSKLLGNPGLGSFEGLTGPRREEHHFHSVSLDIAPFVEVIAGAEWDGPTTLAVLLRQGTFAFAAIADVPENWSDEYRSLFRRTAHALAASVFEAPRFEMPTTPPGIIHLRVPPANEEGAERAFYFKLDRPTTFTVTLEHTGTRAAMLMFWGEKERLYATRKDAEYGESLTITANISQQAIEQNAERYWIVHVGNFDLENAADMTLSIRYNAAGNNEPAIQALPSNLSHEFLAAYADSLVDANTRGEASARERLARYLADVSSVTTSELRFVAAREFGFENWKHLQAHASPLPDWWSRPHLRVVYIDGYYEELKGASGGIGAAEVIEGAATHFGNFSDDLKQTLLAAETAANGAGHAEVTAEHLLLHLLDSPIAQSVLARVACDFPRLREQLVAAVGELAETDSAPQVSRHCFGALFRASNVPTLGIAEQVNAANVLIGMAQEDTHAAALLREHAGETDLYHVVSHGIPLVLPDHRPPDYIPVAEEAQRVFMCMKRQAKGLALFTLEQLLRSTLDHSVFDSVDRDGLDDALARFIARTTPRLDANARSIVRPTLAFDRVTKMAVARAQRRGEPAGTLDLVRAMLGERHGFATAELKARGVTADLLQ